MCKVLIFTDPKTTSFHSLIKYFLMRKKPTEQSTIHYDGNLQSINSCSWNQTSQLDSLLKRKIISDWVHIPRLHWRQRQECHIHEPAAYLKGNHVEHCETFYERILTLSRGIHFAKLETLDQLNFERTLR